MIVGGVLAMEPFSVVWVTRGITAIVGLFVAALAYRGYRRNESPKMRALAIGIGLLTAGAYVAVIFIDMIGMGNGVVLLARGLVTVIGLSVVLYAITMA
jgi:hypothetical protein